MKECILTIHSNQLGRTLYCALTRDVTAACLSRIVIRFNYCFVQIRLENEEDKDSIQVVNESAFETSAEANLVATLREQAKPVVSLVADNKETIIGHIIFSPVTLDEYHELKIMGLGPMAVVPECQRKGIGSALVREGLNECKKLGFGAAVVLGHPNYYPRFDFLPSTRFGIMTEYNVPEDMFMVKELQQGYLDGKKGTIKYHAAFSNL